MSTIVGLDAPFHVLRKPTVGKGAEKVETPSMGMARGVMITRFPTLGGVFWLATPKRRAQSSVVVDGTGQSYPALFTKTINETTPFVKAKTGILEAKFNLDEYLGALDSSGLIRVDHLKDESGEVLGYPSEDVRKGRDSWAKFCRRLENPARLAQLNLELKACYGDRCLEVSFGPQVPSATRNRLESADKKTAGKIDDDRKKLATAKGGIDKFADAVSAAAKGTAKKKTT